MKRTIIWSVTLAAAMLIGQAVASPTEHLNFGKNTNAAQCNPSGGKMILNVTFQVANDADSGFGGYWALDAYNKTVKVYQQGKNSFCAVVSYQGSFVTFAGPSPSGNSTVNAGDKGTFEGGYQATFTGALKADPGIDLKGHIGQFDFGCNQSGACASVFDWLSTYFDSSNGFADFTQNWWGWIYHGGNNGTWVNASTGSSGDITN